MADDSYCRGSGGTAMGPAVMCGALQFIIAVVAVSVPLAAGVSLLTVVFWTLGQGLRRVLRN